MIRRFVALLALAGAGWYLYARVLRDKSVYVGDQADLRPDEARGGLGERVTQAASGVASTAKRAAQAPVERVRSLVGGQEEEQPEGERVVTPEGQAETTLAEVGAGYAPVDDRREPPPTPDSYRPAPEASPSAATTPRREAGATMPQEVDVQAATAPRAASAQADAPAQEQAESEAPTEPRIKGNIRADGERIYHLPEDPAYERTNAETMFASVEEAEAAGFRRAGRPRQD